MEEVTEFICKLKTRKIPGSGVRKIRWVVLNDGHYQKAGGRNNIIIEYTKTLIKCPALMSWYIPN